MDIDECSEAAIQPACHPSLTCEPPRAPYVGGLYFCRGECPCGMVKVSGGRGPDGCKGQRQFCQFDIIHTGLCLNFLCFMDEMFVIDWIDNSPLNELIQRCALEIYKCKYRQFFFFLFSACLMGWGQLQNIYKNIKGVTSCLFESYCVIYFSLLN